MAVLHFLAQLARTLVVSGAALITVALVALYFFQRKLVYPSFLNKARIQVDTPDLFDLPYEEVKITTDDGETLHAYMLLHDSKSLEYTNKTILVLSPNAGNIGHFLPVVQYIYNELHYNVFIYSYRGYGKSTGSPTESGLKKDADAVMKYLASHNQVSKSSVITYGRSLGGAVAIYITAKYGKMISAMILENTFLNIPKVVPHIFPFLKYFSWLCCEFWDSEKDITKINSDIPCLFLAGTKDEIVPPSHMKELFTLVGVKNGFERKNFRVWREFKAYHNDTIVAPGYWEVWYDFVKNHVAPYGK